MAGLSVRTSKLDRLETDGPRLPLHRHTLHGARAHVHAEHARDLLMAESAQIC